MAVGYNDESRLSTVLLHAQAAIVEFYDWLLYEVSPSTLRAASVVGEPERQRGGPALPALQIWTHGKHYRLLYFFFWNTVINFFVEPGESIYHCVIDYFCTLLQQFHYNAHTALPGCWTHDDQRAKV